jgi:cysteine desulfurase
MQLPIYLDYMATTPVDPQVITKMITCLGMEGSFGNSGSQTHYYGWQAADLIENARRQVAALINADSREIIWTSGATESNNLALKGACHFYQRQGKHIITLKTEHKSVLDTCAYLEQEGFKITYLTPDQNGLLNLNDLKTAIQPDTILISIMHVNNETGIIQNIEEISKLAKENGILFHCDAVQAAGKIEIDVQKAHIDLLSISSHKLYGPKGIGALFIRRNPKVRLTSQIHGGGQEQGLRSGTLPTHQIVGMGEACAIAKQRLAIDALHIQTLMSAFWKQMNTLDGLELNGDLNHQVGNCVNISFKDVDNETLLVSIPEIAASGGSACNSASHEPSHVLLAMGIHRKRAGQAIRFSIGRFTTLAEIEVAAQKIITQVQRLRAFSPVS